MDNYVKNNANAWDFESSNHNFWTVSVTEAQIEKATKGVMEMYLTPLKFVRESWVKELKGKKVLALACGGGQQSILMAAAGADVTVVDISKKQLENDEKTAMKANLNIKTIQADMQDLSIFEDSSFDIIYNPTSTCFIKDVEKTYAECFRVLCKNGLFLTSATNPILYLFDEKKELKGKLKVKYTIPYSDLKSLSHKELEKRLKKNDTVEFSHTWQTLLGSIFDSGFIVEDLYTDQSGLEIVDSFVNDCYFAIKARKQ